MYLFYIKSIATRKPNYSATELNTKENDRKTLRNAKIMLTVESVLIIATLTQGNSAIHLIGNADEEGVTEVKMLS